MFAKLCLRLELPPPLLPLRLLTIRSGWRLTRSRWAGMCEALGRVCCPHPIRAKCKFHAGGKIRVRFDIKVAPKPEASILFFYTSQFLVWSWALRSSRALYSLDRL